MHIPNQFPKFESSNALIVVMGSQRGILYHAADGRMDIIGTVEQPTPRYSDREGQFYHSGGGRFMGAGSVYENNNVEHTRKFFKKAANEIYRVIRTYDINHTYVFEPPYAKGAATLALRPLLRDSVELVRYGNFLHAPALTLLAYIKETGERILDPTDPESVSDAVNAEEKRKILRNARMAQEVIGSPAR